MKLQNSIEVLVVETTEAMEERAIMVAKEFASKFGGYNMYEGVGGWVSGDGELIQEKHIRVSANFDNSPSESEVVLTACNAIIYASHQQDAVSLVINGTLYIFDTYQGDMEPEQLDILHEKVRKAVQDSYKRGINKQ